MGCGGVPWGVAGRGGVCRGVVVWDDETLSVPPAVLAASCQGPGVIYTMVVLLMTVGRQARAEPGRRPP